MQTVKDLIEQLSKLPQDARIISRIDDMERHGVVDTRLYPTCSRYRVDLKSTYDAFDYTSYEYRTYVEDPNGDIIAVRL